jgi:hypothetical protein
MWHRYSHEREHGEHDTARALLEGLYDGIACHSGPMTIRGRPGVALAHRVLGWLVGRRAAGNGPAVTAS